MDGSNLMAAANPAAVPVMGPSLPFYATAVLYLAAAVAYALMLSSSRRSAASTARWLLLAAFLAHGVEISWRAINDMHPGMSVREALGFLAWLMVGGYLAATLRYSLQLLGPFIAPVGLVVLSIARLSPSGPLPPELTLLGRIHISLATVGVAIFALATLLAAIYLLEDRNLRRKRFDGVLFRRGIALESLDLLAHRLVLAGFPIFTVAMMLGVIWAAQRESGFDRLEYPLALVTWLSFASLIITRTTHGWRGRRAALLTVVGFVAALLVFATYLARQALS